MELALKNVDKLDLTNCELIEASRLGSIDEFDLSDDTQEIAENLFLKSGFRDLLKTNKFEIFEDKKYGRYT